MDVMSDTEQPVREIVYVGMVYETGLGLRYPAGDIFSVQFFDGKTREIFVDTENTSSQSPSALFLKEGRKTLSEDEVKGLIIRDLYDRPSRHIIQKVRSFTQEKASASTNGLRALQRGSGPHC